MFTQKVFAFGLPNQTKCNFSTKPTLKDCKRYLDNANVIEVFTDMRRMLCENEIILMKIYGRDTGKRNAVAAAKIDYGITEPVIYRGRLYF